MFDGKVTEEEATYFIENKKWPWGSYLIEELSKEIDKAKAEDGFGPPTNLILNLIREMRTSREVYAKEFLDKERIMTPQPISYQIYMGTYKPETIPPSVQQPNTMNPGKRQILVRGRFEML